MSDLLIDLPAAVAVAMMPSAVAVVPMSMELVTLLYIACVGIIAAPFPGAAETPKVPLSPTPTAASAARMLIRIFDILVLRLVFGRQRLSHS
jgi:hypothetical protein